MKVDLSGYDVSLKSDFVASSKEIKILEVTKTISNSFHQTCVIAGFDNFKFTMLCLDDHDFLLPYTPSKSHHREPEFNDFWVNFNGWRVVDDITNKFLGDRDLADIAINNYKEKFDSLV